jgi:hypothetical protein
MQFVFRSLPKFSMVSHPTWNKSQILSEATGLLPLYHHLSGLVVWLFLEHWNLRAFVLVDVFARTSSCRILLPKCAQTSSSYLGV